MLVYLKLSLVNLSENKLLFLVIGYSFLSFNFKESVAVCCYVQIRH